MKRRVVITGLGVCTPVGTGVTDFWSNLLAGRSGLGPVTLFDARSFPIRIAGEVKRLDQETLTARFPTAAGVRDRKVWLGLEAAGQAVADAALPAAEFERALLLVGMSLEAFGLDLVAPAARLLDQPGALARCLLERTERATLQTPLDYLTATLGDHLNVRAGRLTNCSACAAGAQVVGEAFRRLRDGEAAVALVGAADGSLTPLGLGGFGLLQILSPENDQPETACRPFDATRRGTVLSEGAAFLVLESAAHAAARGARVYAEVLGYGSSLDAYRVSDPEPTGRGAVQSMTRALADAGLEPGEVACVNAHGTGTPKNDVTETLALKRVLGEQARRIPVHSIKSMTGHMIAASGAAEAVAAALTLHTRQVPPTRNLRQPDPQCDLDYVPAGPRAFAGRTVLSNSFGFGGQNATLIFGVADLR